MLDAQELWIVMRTKTFTKNNMTYHQQKFEEYVHLWYDLPFNEKLHAMHSYILFPDEFQNKNIINFATMIVEGLITVTENMSKKEIDDLFTPQKFKSNIE